MACILKGLYINSTVYLCSCTCCYLCPKDLCIWFLKLISSLHCSFAWIYSEQMSVLVFFDVIAKGYVFCRTRQFVEPVNSLGSRYSRIHRFSEALLYSLVFWFVVVDVVFGSFANTLQTVRATLLWCKSPFSAGLSTKVPFMQFLTLELLSRISWL